MQNKMKFGIRCQQENAKQRQYSFFRYRNNTVAETETICDITFNFIRNYLAPKNSEVFRFSSNSGEMVNFQQVRLLDVATK